MPSNIKPRIRLLVPQTKLSVIQYIAIQHSSAFFKEFSLGGQNRKKRQNEKYEPSRFGERASLKRDFVKLKFINFTYILL